MDSNEAALKCSINLEWQTPQGTIQKKISHKNAYLKLIRNEFRVMFVEITADKNAPIRLQLKAISVHKNFMNEGKASIKFQEMRCTLYLFNAPTGQLVSFLRTLFVKMTGERAKASEGNVPLRKQLLSNKPKSFEEISPVTMADLNKAKAKVSKRTTTTPSPSSRKRKHEGGEGEMMSKRLYTSSPIPDEVLNVEQKEVLDACLAGHNVFFTGSAGTGKSYLLRKIITALPPDVTVATASTGEDYI